MRGSASLDQLIHDLRYAGRMLGKNPGFAALTVLILALGIGANTAVFSVVHAVLLKPLPFFDPDRLVLLWEDKSQIGFPRGTPAPANYADWKTQSKAFEQIEAVSGRTMNLTGAGEPERLNVDAVTSGLFPMLGVRPSSGRLFLPEEDAPGALKVALVSHALWMRRFGGDPGLVGESIRLNDEKYVVIGILPPDFQFLRKSTELWIPVAFSKQELANRDAHYLTVAGRLKPGVTLQQAQADMESVARRIEEANPISARKLRVVLVPLREQLAGDVRPTLIVLLVAVACILLIACANVANLLLSRAIGRNKEMSLRAALGASRPRLLRQLLTESLLLSASGGAAGLLLAKLSLGILTRLVPASMAALARLELSAPVLLFSMLLSLATAVVFGLMPALRASKLDLNRGLKQSGGRSGAGRSDSRLRSVLVIAETALALALLVCAQLMIQTFLRLKAVDPGFRVENVVTAGTPLPPRRYADASKRTAFYHQVLERIAKLPGVVSAGYVTALPLTMKGGTRSFQIEGVPPAPGRDALTRQISPGYLRTMGIRILQGRGIEERDGPQAPGAAVISETMAQKFWPNESALGKRIKLGSPTNPFIMIVGISGDVKQMGLEAPTKAEIYLSYQQENNLFPPGGDLAIRVAGSSLSLAALQKEIWAVDRELPVSGFQTMEQILDTETLQRRMQMSLLGTFAGLALLLAGLGIYGVMSYAVTQRTQEIGIRMALGADRREVLRMVVGQGMVLALIGVGFGLAGAFGATRLLASLLFGTAANNLFAYFSVSALLIVVALAACFVPARRASRVDPLVALRYE
jgi:putative ABC transport system permease protein